MLQFRTAEREERVRLPPLVDPRGRDTLRISDVAGDQDSIVMDRGGCDQDIRVADRLPGCAQSATNDSEPPSDLRVDAKHADAAQEALEACLMPGRIMTVMDTPLDFANGDDAQRHPVGQELIEQGNRRRAPLEVIRYPIGVDDVRHRSTGGLTDRRRFS